MVGYTSFYLIQPTPELLAELKNEPENLVKEFGRVIMLEKGEGGYRAPSSEGYMIHTRLIFLAWVVNHMESHKRTPERQRLIDRLLGEPPYHINRLDRWWQIERTYNYFTDYYLLQNISAEAWLDCRTDDPDWEAWRVKMVSVMQEFTQYRIAWSARREQVWQIPQHINDQMAFLRSVLYPKPVYTWLVAEIVTRISRYLSNHVYEHDRGRVTLNGTHYQISDDCIVMPDIAYVTKERLPRFLYHSSSSDFLIPELVVEVISPYDRKDYLDKKLLEYEKAGIAVWLVDLSTFACSIRNPGFEPVLTDVFENQQLLPGFQLPVQLIFPDELKSEE